MKGSAEGRRLLGGCALGGAAVGLLAAVGAAYAYRHTSTFELCGPRGQDVCKRLDVAGFELRSSWGAAAVVGPLAAFIAFLVLVVIVLYTSDTPNRHR